MNRITEHTGSLLRFCAMLVLMLGFTSGAALAQFYTEPGASPVADCLTPATACSLGAAVEAARAVVIVGGPQTATIFIADGTYEEDEDFDSIVLPGDDDGDVYEFQGWNGEDAAPAGNEEVDATLDGNAYSVIIGDISTAGLVNLNQDVTVRLDETNLILDGGPEVSMADDSVIEDADEDPDNGGNLEITGSGDASIRVAEPDPTFGPDFDTQPNVTIENLIIDRNGEVEFEEIERFAAVLDPILRIGQVAGGLPVPGGRLLVQDGTLVSSDGTLDLDLDADGNGTPAVPDVPVQLEIADGATLDFDDVTLDIADSGSDEYFAMRGGGTLISSGLVVTTLAQSTWLSFVEIDGGDFNVTALVTSAGAADNSTDGEVIFSRLARVGEDLTLTGDNADTDFVFERNVTVEGNTLIDDGTLLLAARTLANGTSILTVFEGNLTFDNEAGLNLGHDPNGGDPDSYHNVESQGDITVLDEPVTPAFPGGMDNVFRIAGSDDAELLLEEDLTLFHAVVDMANFGDEAEILEDSGAQLVISPDGYLLIFQGELTSNGNLEMPGATLELAQGGELDRNAGDLAYTSEAHAPSDLIYSGASDFVRRTADEIEQVDAIDQLTVRMLTVQLDQDLILNDELELDDGGILNLSQFDADLTLDIDGPDNDGTGEEGVADEFTITVDRGSVVGDGNLVYPSQTISDFEPGLDGILLDYTTESGTHVAGAEFPSNGFATEVKTLSKMNAGTTQLRSGETFQTNSDVSAEGGVLDLNGATLVVNQPINNTNVDVHVDQDGNLINSSDDGHLLLQGEDLITVSVESNEGDDAHGAFGLPGILVDMSSDGDRTTDEQQVAFLDINDDPLAGHGSTVLNVPFFTILDAGTSTAVGEEGVLIHNTVDGFNVAGLFLQQDGSFSYAAPAPLAPPLNVLVDLSSENVNSLTAETFTQTGGWAGINGTPFDVATTFTTMNDGSEFWAEGSSMSATDFNATGGGFFNLGGGGLTIANDVMVDADSDFQLASGTNWVSGDFTLLGSGDVTGGHDAGQGLRGTVVFQGTGEQIITAGTGPESQFNHVVLDNSAPLGGAGLMLASGVTQNDTAELDLLAGIVSTEMHDWVLLNTAIDEIDFGSVPTAGPIEGGHRGSFFDDTFARAISGESASGGVVFEGYWSPVGNRTINADGTTRTVFRPLMQEFPELGTTSRTTVTLLEPSEVSLTPPNILVDQREPGEEQVTRTLELNVLGEAFWRVEYDVVPPADANIRLFADRQGGIIDITDVRILQYPCPDGPQFAPRLAGVYDLFDDPTDDFSVGLNDFINGVPSLVQEGVDLFECQIFAVASEASINPLSGDGGSVDGNTVSGTVVYGDSDTGVSGATVTLSQGEATVASTTTDADGNFTLSGVADGTYDITASSSFASGAGLSGADALQVVRHFVGEITLSANAQIAADVNGDGTINSADALRIAQRAADPSVTFAGGDSFGETEQINVTGDVTGIELSVFAMGDVNQSFDPTAGAGKQAVTALSEITVGGESRAVQIGEAFELPIKAASSVSVGALTMEIDFPSEMATFAGLSGLDGAITHVSGNKLRVVWFDAKGDSPLAVDKGETLFSVRFRQSESVIEGDAFATKFAAEIVDQHGEVLSANLSTDLVEFGSLPETFALMGNYPNPFNPSTTVTFDLPTNADVHVEIFDVMGRRVMSLPAEEMSAGAAKQISIDASDLASGTYLYRILARGTSDTFSATGRMMLVK